MIKSPSEGTLFAQSAKFLASDEGGKSLAHLSKIFWRSSAVVAIGDGARALAFNWSTSLDGECLGAVSEPQPPKKTAIINPTATRFMFYRLAWLVNGRNGVAC